MIKQSRLIVFDALCPDLHYDAHTVEEWHGVYAYQSAWLVLHGWDKAQVEDAALSLVRSSVGSDQVWRYMHMLKAWLENKPLAHPLVLSPIKTWPQAFAVQSLCDLTRAVRAHEKGDDDVARSALMNAMGAAAFARSEFTRDTVMPQVVLDSIKETQSELARRNAGMRNRNVRFFALSAWKSSEYQGKRQWVDAMVKLIPTRFPDSKLPKNLRRVLYEWLRNHKLKKYES